MDKTLGRLEESVARLVERLKAADQRNAALQAEIDGRDAELAEARRGLARTQELESRCADLEHEMDRLESARDEARRRVEALLGNLSKLDP